MIKLKRGNDTISVVSIIVLVLLSFSIAAFSMNETNITGNYFFENGVGQIIHDNFGTLAVMFALGLICLGIYARIQPGRV